MNISVFKKIAACLVLAFAFQMVMIPAHSYAGCGESAAKSIVATVVVGGGLVLLDFAFTGGFFTSLALAKAGAAAVGIKAAAMALTAKGAVAAAVTGCAESWIFDKPSSPSR